MSRRRLAHYGAPALFLLGVTIAVLLVRAGLGGPAPATGTLGPVTQPAAAPVPKPAKTVADTGGSVTTATLGGPVYYTVQSGDTFGAIAAKEGTTVAEIEALNPGVSPNALQVGQKIRVK